MSRRVRVRPDVQGWGSLGCVEGPFPKETQSAASLRPFSGSELWLHERSQRALMGTCPYTTLGPVSRVMNCQQ